MLSQPEPPSASVHGVVLSHDGSVAAGSRVDLRCGDWRQASVAGADGTFVFTAVPAVACTLVAQAPGEAGTGVSLGVPLERGERLAVLLPAGITNAVRAAGDGLKIDLASDVAPPPTRFPSTKVSGVASWTAGLDPFSPAAPPDQWSVGATITRPGPWGTLLKGTASARRVSGATTLLSDVTGAPGPGAGMWSALFDPSRTMVWDVRLGLEKHWKVGGTDVTLFGDVYRSFQAGATGNELPLPESATKGLRTGAAGRFGVTLGF